ncbi:MAG TPA: TolC family protein [Acidiferrobacter sp.]|nr:TolC family protein [Acidiferrobacter sp.]
MVAAKTIAVLWAGLILAGCATYTSRPLTAQRVAADLAVRRTTPFWLARAHLLLPQLPPLVVHKGQGLTPDLAAVIAVVGDPTLRALRRREALARAQVLAAGLLPNPTFSYGVGIPMNGTGLTRAFQIGLDLPIRSLLTRPAATEAARYHAQAVDLTVAWQEWQVAARARALVYEILIDRRERRLLAHEVHARQDSAARLAAAQAAGYATVGANLAAHLALERTEHAQLTVRRDDALRRLQLKALLGVDAHQHLRLANHLPLGDFAGQLRAATWLSGLSRRRLDLLALQRGYKSRDAALRATIIGQFPAITIGVNRARDTSGINTLGGGVTLGLPFFNHHQGAIAIARADRRLLYRTYEARLFAVRSDIHRLLTSMRYLRRQIRTSRSTVHTLNHLETLYRGAFADHRITALAYYRLRDHVAAERLTLLKDEARMDQLVVALETASGRFEWPQPQAGARS